MFSINYAASLVFFSGWVSVNQDLRWLDEKLLVAHLGIETMTIPLQSERVFLETTRPRLELQFYEELLLVVQQNVGISIGMQILRKTGNYGGRLIIFHRKKSTRYKCRK